MRIPFKEGNRVQYNWDWVRSADIYLGDGPVVGSLGTVVGIAKFGDRGRILVRVVWDGDNHESRVLGANLVLK